MAKEVLCPICGATYNLAEAQLGKKVRCKKCEHAFTAGGEPRRREEDDDEGAGIQTEPRGRPRPRARKDRDRDDDRPRKTRSAEEQARPRSREGSGQPMTAIVITCVALGVLVLCCGGGLGAYYLLPFSQTPQPPPPMIQRPLNPPILPAPVAQANPPRPAFPPVEAPPVIVFPPDFPQGGFPGGRLGPGARMGPPITNVKEALGAVRDNDPARRWAGADWLSRATRDEAQAAEVSKALDPLVRNAQPDVFGHDPPRQGALKALKVWGTKENVPTLVQFLQREKGNHGAPVHMADQLKEAMTDLARIGDERGVEGIFPWVGDFFIGAAAEGALREMGPAAAKGLVKYYNDPDDAGRGRRFPGEDGNGGKRQVVRRLLREIGTKPEVILAQVALDLKTGDSGRRRLAAECLDTLPLVEALRDEMSRALNAALEDPSQDVAAACLKAAKTWGTRENVPALIRHVGEGGQLNTRREAAMEALAALKDERGIWPIARWLGDPFNGQGAEAAIKQFGPTAEKVGLEHLKDAEGPSRLQAWRVLAVVGTPANVPTMKAAIAKERDPVLRTAATNAVRLVEQR
jgi:predicted Zn finger-like uncharacterized protein